MIERNKFMIFEKASIEYCEQLVKLRILYLTEDHGTLSSEDTKRISDSLPDYYKKHLNKDLFVYICRNENEIVSCCFLLVTEKPANPDFINGKTGTVLNVYTKPEHRKKGYARKLIESMLADAKTMELDYVELKATEDGYSLYKDVGFDDIISKYHNMKYVL